MKMVILAMGAGKKAAKALDTFLKNGIRQVIDIS